MRRTLHVSFMVLSVSTIAAGPRSAPVPQLSAPITIAVDAAVNRHPIDPRIYGLAFASQAAMADLDIPINRWGGNGTSRYNWAISASNHARDNFFENIADDVPPGHTGANGESADLFIQPTFAAGAQPLMTIPMLAYLPMDRVQRCGYSIALYAQSGCCLTKDDPFHPDCGDGFHNVTKQPLKNVNNPLDIEILYPSSHQGDWIQHNINTFGTASTTGVKYYALDNEPGLWDSTHFDIHPGYETYDELWAKTQEYGALIKAKDPAALISGIEEWGWLGYWYSASDWNKADYADLHSHGEVYHTEWLLQKARAYEQAQGVRILDIASLHAYPQGLKGDAQGLNTEFNPQNPNSEILPATKTLRNQSTRQLWDPNYLDQSWMQDVGPAPDTGKLRVIPRLREWVNRSYPGTKIGITEYNWGAEGDMSGGTSQADILGIFGREGLDLGVRWTTPAAGSPPYNAFKMYRNYDNAHARFGDLSVSAVSPDPDNVAAFAALRSSDRALTVMIVGKNFTDTTPVTVSIANFSPTGSAEVRQLTSANTFAPVGFLGAGAGPSYMLNVPPSTITMLIIPGSYLDAPTGVVATATSTSNVNVAWSAVGSATNYRVLRSATVSGPETQIASTASLSISDGGRAANTTYLYRVQASNGVIVSAPSVFDPATTTMFTDDPLNAGTLAKRQHINELRTAANALRAAAGLPAAIFTNDPALTGTPIKANHLLELRVAIDQARATLGLSAGVWSDPAIVPRVTRIRAAQIIAVRNGVK